MQTPFVVRVVGDAIAAQERVQDRMRPVSCLAEYDAEISYHRDVPDKIGMEYVHLFVLASGDGTVLV